MASLKINCSTVISGMSYEKLLQDAIQKARGILSSQNIVLLRDFPGWDIFLRCEMWTLVRPDKTSILCRRNSSGAVFTLEMALDWNTSVVAIQLSPFTQFLTSVQVDLQCCNTEEHGLLLKILERILRRCGKRGIGFACEVSLRN